MDFGPVSFGQIEVVAVECVLGVEATSHQAPATADATRPVRPGTTKKGIDRGYSRLAEKDPNRGWAVGFADSKVGCHLLYHVVRWSRSRVRGGSEHAPRLVVEGGQFALPIGDGGPLRVPVESVVRFIEGVGVDQGTAAHPGT